MGQGPVEEFSALAPPLGRFLQRRQQGSTHASTGNVSPARARAGARIAIVSKAQGGAAQHGHGVRAAANLPARGGAPRTAGRQSRRPWCTVVDARKRPVQNPLPDPVHEPVDPVRHCQQYPKRQREARRRARAQPSAPTFIYTHRPPSRRIKVHELEKKIFDSSVNFVRTMIDGLFGSISALSV
jgi:hypothetical protein